MAYQFGNALTLAILIYLCINIATHIHALTLAQTTGKVLRASP